jgi:large subunit ribosomal protein L10
MENPRPAKVAVVDEVRERLDSASAAILTEYRGLKVKDLAGLRRSLREAGGEYKIYKNTLVRLAVRELGLAEGVEMLLEGPTAITFVDGDAVDVAKALRDFARTNPNLVVKGGLLGSKVLSAKDASALADLPTRDVLLARLAGAFAAPMVQFAGLLQALPRNFAYGLKALIEQRGGVEPAPAEPDVGPEVAAVEADVTAHETAEAAPLAAEPTSATPVEADVVDEATPAEAESAATEPAAAADPSPAPVAETAAEPTASESE